VFCVFLMFLSVKVKFCVLLCVCLYVCIAWKGFPQNDLYLSGGTLNPTYSLDIFYLTQRIISPIYKLSFQIFLKYFLFYILFLVFLSAKFSNDFCMFFVKLFDQRK